MTKLLWNGKDWYVKKYLKSPHWIEFAKVVRQFWDDKCCLCNKPARDVHHRTYKRLGEELLQDVVLLCRDCHNKHHSKLGEDQDEVTNEEHYDPAGSLCTACGGRLYLCYPYHPVEDERHLDLYCKSDSVDYLGSLNRIDELVSITKGSSQVPAAGSKQDQRRREAEWDCARRILYNICSYLNITHEELNTRSWETISKTIKSAVNKFKI